MVATVVLIALAAPPTSGDLPAAYEPIDDVVIEIMNALRATAASVAVYRADEEIFTRAYGWADRGKRRPVTPENTFRIASNTKPFTAAAIRELLRNSDLTLDTPMLDALNRSPTEQRSPADDELGDSRLRDITINHLLNHRAGWNRDESFDPLYRLGEIHAAGRRSKPLTMEVVIDYMLKQPLQSDPGEEYAYSNFCYLTLGRIIEVQTGKSFNEYLDKTIAKPLGIDDLAVSHRIERRRPRLEVEYPVASDRRMQVRAASGGQTTSPRSLCKFMNAYWATGVSRRPGDRRLYYHFGSLPDTTTSVMVQRRDGINWAIAFNARKNGTFEEDLVAIRSRIDRVIDDASKGSR